MTRRSTRAFAPLTILTLFAAPSFAPAQEPGPAAARLRADVAYLADDAREGRAPGTPGIEAAAGYIADAFKAAGLKPAEGADGYFQPFAIRGEPRLVGEPFLALAGPDGKRLEARQKVDFTPLVVGGPGRPRGPAGRLRRLRDHRQGRDGRDRPRRLRRPGRRGQGGPGLPPRPPPGGGRHPVPRPEGDDLRDLPPQGPQRRRPRREGRPAGQRPRRPEGQARRAAFLRGPRPARRRHPLPDGLPRLRPAPAGRLRPARAGRAGGRPPGREVPPHGRPLEGWTLASRVEIERASIPAKNVVGVLEGAGPHANETVVVGAHYDHLGHGGAGSLAFGSKEIHNGADDNASGTALVMELARRLGRRADPPPRRIVFMAFSGEEMGLLGSAHYVTRPLYPLRDTVMMLNFDMVGRLGEKGELSVYGTNSAPGLDPLVEALGRDEGLTIRKSTGALLGDRFSMASDHASFLLRRVPYLFFFTGVHRDYHRPSDDVEAINFPGMARVADLGELVLLDVVRRPARPEFLAAQAPAPHGGGDHAAPAKVGEQDPGAAGRAYFGSIPDYSDGDPAGGVKLTGAREGSPADKAGIKAGDVVVKFAGEPIETLEDYSEALAGRKPGEVVEVIVRRDGKAVPLKATLGSSGEAAK